VFPDSLHGISSALLTVWADAMVVCWQIQIQIQIQLELNVVCMSHVTAASTFEMHNALALVLSHPSHVASLSTLARILQNTLSHPSEAKFRNIRLGNKKVQEEIVGVDGAIDFLQACGFEIQPGDNDDDIGCAQLPENCGLGRLRCGWQELCSIMHANGLALPVQKQAPTPRQEPKAPAAPPAPPPAPAPAPDRNTQVILPVAADTSVPDWFFNCTGAELKAEYMRMKQKRESSEQFSTREMREREAVAAQGRRPTTATVRVRFPEGVCLQGMFGVREPLSALHSWLADSLRSPGITYDLVEPGRSKLQATGSVGDAGLAPACVLNLRPTGDSVHMFRGMSLLSDVMLRQTRARY